MSGTYIKLYREIDGWEWYKNSDMVHLWIHFLISANHKDNKWQGQTIKTGQFITGRQVLSEATGISEQTIRTCIERLKSTNEITTKPTNRFTLITIVNWDKYQGKPTSQSTSQSTNNQPTTNQQLTTNKNDKNDKNDKNICTFENFWKEYPRKENKKKAQDSWLKVNPSEYDKIMSALKAQKETEQWLAGGGKYVPHPTTWLNGRRWEDEVLKASLGAMEIKIPEYAKKLIRDK